MIDIRFVSPISSAEIPQSYKDGGEAYKNKLGISTNPNTKGTKAFEDWEHGWYDAEGYDDYQSGNLD